MSNYLKILYIFCFSVGVFAGPACGDRRVQVAGDGGFVVDGKVVKDNGGRKDTRPALHDRGPKPDGRRPVKDLRPGDTRTPRPDRPRYRDQFVWPTDGPRPPLDRGVCKAMGQPCVTDKECCTSLSCAKIYTGARVCTRPCTEDNKNTPLINEDSCPGMGSTFICTNIAATSPKILRCLQRCTPNSSKPTCPSGLSCDPRSTWLTYTIDKAVCAFRACKTGQDCPVYLTPFCLPAGPARQCASAATGAFCAPYLQGSMGGRCALSGVCDTRTGLCQPHKRGKATAKVGGTCKDDRDCGPQMECLQELSTSTTAYHRNGYCTIVGCVFSATVPKLTCPAGSTCARVYAAGYCLKSCDLQKASTCRNNPKDRHGDYECRAWNRYVGTPGTLAKTPVCQPGHAAPCAMFSGSRVTCANLGLGGNPTTMACRQVGTGKILPQHSAGGTCLDTTSSGK